MNTKQFCIYFTYDNSLTNYIRHLFNIPPLYRSVYLQIGIYKYSIDTIPTPLSINKSKPKHYHAIVLEVDLLSYNKVLKYAKNIKLKTKEELSIKDIALISDVLVLTNVIPCSYALRNVSINKFFNILKEVKLWLN